MTFIAQIVKLFKQTIDLALRLGINFLYLDIFVLSVLLFLNESIRAKRFFTSLAVKDYF